MKFFDSLREKFAPGFDARERLRVAQLGEKLEAFVESGAFDVFDEAILQPMEKESFEAFKTLAPGSKDEIIQTQKMAQIVAEIRRRLEKKIRNGLDARQQILDDSTQEGER